MPLNIDWQQILLHLFNFTILAAGLYVLLYRPVLAFMDKRKAHYETVEQEIAQKDALANEKMEQCEARLSEMDETLRQRAAEADRLLDEQNEERMAKARAQAEQVLADASASARRERERILDGANKELAGLVVSATQKLMQNGQDEKAEKALYDRFVEAMQEEQPK